jgi:hypothetical protein
MVGPTVHDLSQEWLLKGRTWRLGQLDRGGRFRRNLAVRSSIAE